MSSTELPQDLKEINGDINGVEISMGDINGGINGGMVGSDSIGSEQSYIGTRESHAEEKLSSKYIDTQEVK